MDDIDPKAWADAAQYYTRLRRICLRFLLGFAALFLVGGLLAALFQAPKNKSASVSEGFVAAIFMLAGLICLAGSLISSTALANFRCPRCGKRFTRAWWGNWYGSRCLHCNFDLVALSLAKPHPVEDL